MKTTFLLSAASAVALLFLSSPASAQMLTRDECRPLTSRNIEACCRTENWRDLVRRRDAYLCLPIEARSDNRNRVVSIDPNDPDGPDDPDDPDNPGNGGTPTARGGNHYGNDKPDQNNNPNEEASNKHSSEESKSDHHSNNGNNN